ncbi:hypothetical protein PCASD_02581 [Puccinia coronata f. sp. avenae]|uniref:Uncharacterized protein n=2 Tax=Puccinia coronata f. sp. avenae TaxID=200324 RepID=A0A2N5VBB2_9BASI|nr:hypothetical protein PCASD_02581 [Puccinia coronata f. sp. avenae]
MALFTSTQNLLHHTLLIAITSAQDEDKLVECIKALTVFVLQGLDAAAGAGELASRIILFCAMQRALASAHKFSFDYGHPVRLVDFLKALTGVEAKDLDLGITDADKKRDLLDNGMIFWNHFSLIKYSPSSKDLLKFMYRSMAAQCKQNQAGFDQIFTIYLKRESESADLEERNISFGGVQVKNRQSAIDLVKENYKWTDRFAKVKLLEENPYLVLFMDLHGIRPEDKDSNNTRTGISTLPSLDTISTRSSSERTDHRRASLVFHGFDHFHCLSQPVADALKALIDTEPDFVKLNTTESGKLYSRTINPCLYSTE